jgi:hypothetical protein
MQLFARYQARHLRPLGLEPTDKLERIYASLLAGRARTQANVAMLHSNDQPLHNNGNGNGRRNGLPHRQAGGDLELVRPDKSDPKP